ncbi:winged helix-turn-helix domain-containing protein [Shewanella litorisediminis]|uniref:winged helix-turn-helix domain-containing protein n=2 Tax=Shewanella litorisediminis TaxID=1173586 RepID=UPI0024B3838C|nr:winged helix-turn-helix domain-containing protein [Shewanella litorisediminis]
MVIPERCVITNNGSDTKLEFRVMQVLVCLLERAGRPVTRDELIKEVWRGGQVSDNAINRIVAQLRNALGDDARTQQVIQTVPKVGYLLIAEVEPLESQPVTLPVATLLPEPHHVKAPEAAIEAEGSKQLNSPNTSDNKPVTGQSKHSYLVLAAYAMAGVLLSLLAFVVWDSVSQSREAKSEPVQDSIASLLPLTSLEGQEVDPVLSPDGNKLAFAFRDLSASEWRILVQDLTTGQVSLADNAPTANNQRHPAWSDDGGHLAYLNFDGKGRCELVLLDLLTRHAKVVSECDKATQSSALAIRGQELYFVDSDGVGDFKKIYQVNLNTLKKEQLSRPHSIGRGDYGLSLSPDKSQMAVLRNLSWFDTQLMVFNFSTGEWRQVLKVGYPLKSVAWSQDGKGLIYRAEEGQLHRYDLDTGERVRLTKILQEINSPRSNSKGQTAAVVGELMEEELWHWSVPGNTKPEPWVSSSRRDYRGAMSPDGALTAFVSNRTGLPQIWLRRINGEEIKLTHFDRFSFIDELTFSPNGKLLAGTINGAAFTLELAKSEIHFIPGRTSVRNISFGMSADELVMFSSEAGKRQIQLVDMNTGKMLNLLAENGFSGKFDRVSGEFYYSKMNSSGIWKLTQGVETQVTDKVTPLFSGGWHVADGRIWYLKSEEGLTKLIELDVNHARENAHPIPIANVSMNTLSMTNNNQVLLSVLANANTDIFIVK